MERRTYCILYGVQIAIGTALHFMRKTSGKFPLELFTQVSDVFLPVLAVQALRDDAGLRKTRTFSSA